MQYSVTSIGKRAFSEATECRIFPKRESANIIAVLNESRVRSIACFDTFISSQNLENWKALIGIGNVAGREVLRLTLSISCCKQAYSAGDEKTKGFIRTIMLLYVRRMGSEKRLPFLPLEMWDMIVSFVDVNYAIKSGGDFTWKDSEHYSTKRKMKRRVVKIVQLQCQEIDTVIDAGIMVLKCIFFWYNAPKYIQDKS